MQKKPNVVIFMLDTQRADNIGCYGYEKPTTPHIDTLAKEGTVFLDNISPAIWTLPSIASLMTGVHVHSHGSGARTDIFVGTQPTIAEILAQHGYHTIAFWGNKFGFVCNKGFRETRYNPGAGGRIDAGIFDVSRDRVRRATRWIEQNYLEDDKKVPFFMYLQIMDPHTPLFPRSPFKEQFVLPDATDEEIANLDQDPFSIHAGVRRPSERDYALFRSMYDAQTAAADSHVGVLAEFMREKDILDETIFIVMSDHGEMIGEKKNYTMLDDDALDHFSHHLCVYEELIKVPLVVRYPEKFPSGQSVKHYSQTHDIFPTLSEIIGFEAPHCQGFSLLSTLTDSPERTFTLTEYSKSVHMSSRLISQWPDLDPRIYLRWIKAWRSGGMKYIWTSDCADQLYDLKKDSHEQHNLIREMPEKAKEMRLEMENLLMTCPNGMVGDIIQPKGRITSDALKRLEAMDWLQ